MSVWVEMPVGHNLRPTILSRSTWACELKFHTNTQPLLLNSHAPRERVSWNDKYGNLISDVIVTLHVSVWVEIMRILQQQFEQLVTLHVSVWVEIPFTHNNTIRPMSRSTWACELKFNRQRKNLCRHWSRSTWACELKFHDLRHISASVMVTLHVSVWVEIFIPMLVIQPNYVTLHVSVWVEIDKKLFFLCFYASRSTWACELK